MESAWEVIRHAKANADGARTGFRGRREEVEGGRAEEKAISGMSWSVTNRREGEREPQRWRKKQARGVVCVYCVDGQQ